MRSKAPKWLKSTLIRAYELECADQAYLIEAPNDWWICIHIHQIDGCFDTRSNSDVVGDPGGDNDLVAIRRTHRSRCRKQRGSENCRGRVRIQIAEVYIIVPHWIE